MAKREKKKKPEADAKPKPEKNPPTEMAITTPRGFLGKKQKIIAKFCATGADSSVIIRSALLAFEESWKLQKALETPRGRNSVYHAMLRAASTGLSLNPLEGKAALVPYSSKNKQTGEWETTVTYQVMKNGIIELALTSGVVEHVSADVIRENDSFEIKKTSLGDDFEFIPALTGRGAVIGVYSSVKLRTGSSSVCYMSWEEIEEHRDRYSSSYKYDQKEKTNISPWTNSEEGMGIKTCLKKMFRNIYISPEINRAVAADDNAEGITVIDVHPDPTSGPEDIARQLAEAEARTDMEDENTIDIESVEETDKGEQKTGAGF